MHFFFAKNQTTQKKIEDLSTIITATESLVLTNWVCLKNVGILHSNEHHYSGWTDMRFSPISAEWFWIMHSRSKIRWGSASSDFERECDPTGFIDDSNLMLCHFYFQISTEFECIWNVHTTVWANELNQTDQFWNAAKASPAENVCGKHVREEFDSIPLLYCFSQSKIQIPLNFVGELAMFLVWMVSKNRMQYFSLSRI